MDQQGEPVFPAGGLAGFVLGEADTRGQRTALIDAPTGRRITYGELASAVRRVATSLHGRGVAKGDVFAMWCPNSPEFVIAYYAALSVGAVVAPVNPMATAGDLARQLDATSARWLLTTPDLLAKAGAAALRPLRKVFVVGAAERATPFAALLDGADPVPPEVPIGPDDVALLPCSSGTTGLPKTVVLEHRNLVASLHQTADAQRVGASDVLVAAVPLFHIYGMQVVMNLGLRAGAAVVLLPRFDLDGFLRAVQDHGVTRADVVPPIVVALGKHPDVGAYDLSSLRIITSAAAPLGVGVARRCAERLGCRVKQAYGMTEAGGGTHFAPDEGDDKPGSIGPALPGVECTVVDFATGTPVAPGQPGELLVRCAGTMRGYLDDPEATAATIDEHGWLRTGDVVTVDGDGWFSVVDRVKELVKYKGYQVAPAELEAVLLSHPAVADAAVVASPDEEAGEVPKAYVVLRAPASADELLAHVAERVAPYKKVRRLQFVDQIPKAPSGKILRRVLVEREVATAVSELAAATRRPDAGPNRGGSMRTPEGLVQGTAVGPEHDLRGTVVVVTGGGRGLGRVMARTLGAAGASVGLVARSAGQLDETVRLVEESGGVAAAVPADVSDEGATADAFGLLRERLGPVDVLVNNAGVGGPIGRVWEVDAAEWWRTVEINLKGVFSCTRLVLPDMVARRRGRIINVTSEAGVYRWPKVSAYAVSKSAVVKFTENLAAETKHEGIVVLSFHPGLQAIGLTEAVLSDEAISGSPHDEVARWLRRELAGDRAASPERAGEIVVRLAAGGGDALSGRHLSVHDDLDLLVERLADIRRDDLCALRLRELSPRPSW